MADLEANPKEVPVAAAARPKRLYSCPRCSGRMLAHDAEGDQTCFSCGHVVYGLAPLEDPSLVRRGASHAGWRLT